MRGSAGEAADTAAEPRWAEAKEEGGGELLLEVDVLDLRTCAAPLAQPSITLVVGAQRKAISSSAEVQMDASGKFVTWWGQRAAFRLALPLPDLQVAYVPAASVGSPGVLPGGSSGSPKLVLPVKAFATVQLQNLALDCLHQLEVPIGDPLATTPPPSESTLRLRLRLTRRAGLYRRVWTALFQFLDDGDTGTINAGDLELGLRIIGQEADPVALDGLFEPEEGRVSLQRLLAFLEHQEHGVQALPVLHSQSRNIVWQSTCSPPQSPLTTSPKFAETLQPPEDPIWNLFLALAAEYREVEEAWQELPIIHAILADDNRMELPPALPHSAAQAIPFAAQRSTRVEVWDRQSERVVEELVPRSIHFSLGALYGSSVQTFITTKGLRNVLRLITCRAKYDYETPQSATKIPAFVAYHGINMNHFALPVEEYRTFNEFFCRRLQEGARPISQPDDDTVAVTAADSRCLVFPSFDDSTHLWVKGRGFTIDSLLQDEDLSALYNKDCSVCIFRLSPQDYHRFHFSTGGQVASIRHIQGEYFTVNPVAVRSTVSVFTENARSVLSVRSSHFGVVTYVAVGATLVGSIAFSVAEGDEVVKGQELGFFCFGGSTVVVLFQPGVMQFEADLLRESQRPRETLVLVGQPLGRAVNRVVLRGLPPDVSRGVVWLVCSQFGAVQQIDLHEMPPEAKATAKGSEEGAEAEEEGEKPPNTWRTSPQSIIAHVSFLETQAMEQCLGSTVTIRDQPYQPERLIGSFNVPPMRYRDCAACTCNIA